MRHGLSIFCQNLLIRPSLAAEILNRLANGWHREAYQIGVGRSGRPEPSRARAGLPSSGATRKGVLHFMNADMGDQRLRRSGVGERRNLSRHARRWKRSSKPRDPTTCGFCLTYVHQLRAPYRWSGSGAACSPMNGWLTLAGRSRARRGEALKSC